MGTASLRRTAHRLTTVSASAGKRLSLAPPALLGTWYRVYFRLLQVLPPLTRGGGTTLSQRRSNLKWGYESFTCTALHISSASCQKELAVRRCNVLEPSVGNITLERCMFLFCHACFSCIYLPLVMCTISVAWLSRRLRNFSPAHRTLGYNIARTAIFVSALIPLGTYCFAQLA